MASVVAETVVVVGGQDCVGIRFVFQNSKHHMIIISFYLQLVLLSMAGSLKRCHIKVKLKLRRQMANNSNMSRL